MNQSVDLACVKWAWLTMKLGLLTNIIERQLEKKHDIMVITLTELYLEVGMVR